ncbi:hypothetical protein ACFPYI_14100 [Halomarina salina]|uniref:Uncharacterized protein n=1 Tax=Halomarina salina TaxID=1872699 RepID=A0ABD5RPP9_9EURY|nr:hypothetical protein [Halomarina salina]
MNRRRYLGVTGSLLTTLAGCVASNRSTSSSNESTTASTTTATPSPTSTSETPDGIADSRFQQFLDVPLYQTDEESTDYAGPIFTSVDEVHHGATVRFQCGSNRVIVDGWMYSNSRSCRTTILDAVRYDATSNTLRLTIRDTFEEGPEGCTTEINPVLYRATVEVVAECPETVHVTHYDEALTGETYNETFHVTSTATTTGAE